MDKKAAGNLIKQRASYMRNHKAKLSNVFDIAVFSGMDLSEPSTDTVVATAEHFDEGKPTLFMTSKS